MLPDIPLLEIAVVLLAYLLGSVSSAIIVCRLMRLPDPRENGSGNPGATNVLRIGGKKAAAITLFGDMLKGYLPTALAVYAGLDTLIIILIGTAAFIGHLWPIFFRFEGGKGVATLLGVLFGLDPVIGAFAGAVWLLIAKGLKISSLAALIAMTLAPVFVWYWTGYPDWTIGVSLMSLLLIWRHKSNIQRLLSGEEGIIGR